MLLDVEGEFKTERVDDIPHKTYSDKPATSDMRRRSLIKSIGVGGAGLSAGDSVRAQGSPSEDEDTSEGATLGGDFPVEKIPEPPNFSIGESPPEDHSATVSFWNDADQTRDVLLYIVADSTPPIWWVDKEMTPGEVISIAFRAPRDFNIQYQFEEAWETYRLPADQIDCNNSKVWISIHEDGSTSVSGYHTQLYCGAEDEISPASD